RPDACDADPGNGESPRDRSLPSPRDRPSIERRHLRGVAQRIRRNRRRGCRSSGLRDDPTLTDFAEPAKGTGRAPGRANSATPGCPKRGEEWVDVVAGRGRGEDSCQLSESGGGKAGDWNRGRGGKPR